MTTDERFWSKVAKGDGCWEWTGPRQTDGYGLFWDGRGQVRAHRYAYGLDRIPVGLSVLHECDNRRCVRPDHLRVGTQRENMADMDARGRRFSPLVGRPQDGERNGNARVTAEQVAHIRGMAQAGHYHDAIADGFGINRATVSYIARGKTWRDVEPIPYPKAERTRPVGRSAKRKRLAAASLAD